MMVAFPLDDWLQSSRAEFESASALVLEDAIMWPDDMFSTQGELGHDNHSSNPQDEADSSVGSASVPVAEYSDHPAANTSSTSPPASQVGQNLDTPMQPVAHSRSPRVGFSRESLARINSVLSSPSQSVPRNRTASGMGLPSAVNLGAPFMEKPSTIANSPSSTSLASRLGLSINARVLPTKGNPPSAPHRGHRRRKSSPRKASFSSFRPRPTTSSKSGHWVRRSARSD